ncbi:hypothetical protein [Cerasicoccus fimbriatus]|uniref:hypothetical protein n=1 Tax=Cerasicoccus fimbriatus TaxID=3014554 RepID=UPI0022B496CC|nr:hypothetical protein [Cerasicoccus sp. TK19100]
MNIEEKLKEALTENNRLRAAIAADRVSNGDTPKPARSFKTLTEAQAEITLLQEALSEEKMATEKLKAISFALGISEEADIKAMSAEEVKGYLSKAIESKASSQAQQICAQQGIDYELPTHASEKPTNSQAEQPKASNPRDRAAAEFTKQVKAIHQ